MNKAHYFIFLFVGFIICSCSMAEAQSSGIVKFKQKPEKEIIEISVPTVGSRKIFTVPNPDRLVVDVASVTGKPSVSLPDDYKGKLVKAARFGQFDPKTSRFVFDLNRSVRVVGSRIEGKTLFIEIDDKAAKNDKPKQDKIPDAQKNANFIQKPVVSPQNIREDKKSKVSKKTKPSGPPLIVIDAGHGGVATICHQPRSSPSRVK